MRAFLMMPALLSLVLVSPSWSWDLAIEISGTEVIGTETTFTLEFHIPEGLVETNYCFDEGEYVRYYALMPPGGSVFVIPSVCYIAKRELQVGDSWDFWIGDESGMVYEAEVVALEALTTPFGHFPEVYITEYTDPGSGTLQSRGFHSMDVGLVRLESLDAGVNYELLGIPAPLGGSGAFPLAVGNRWEYGIDLVPVESTTWSEIKAQYHR